MTGRRPPSILAFRWTVYLVCLLAFAATYVFWLTRRQIVDPTHAPARYSFYVVALIIGFTLVLTWMMARHANNGAKWVYVVLSGLGLLLGLFNRRGILAAGDVYAALALAQYELMAASIWLLFRQDARRWFRGEWVPVDPEIFR